MSTQKLKDKVGLIIGEASEKSRNLGVALAECGADVALIYSNLDHKLATSIKEEIEEIGRSCCTVYHDNEQTATIEDAITEVVDVLGAFDFFVSYAPAQQAQKNGTGKSTRSRLNQALLARFFPNFQITKSAMEKMVTD